MLLAARETLVTLGLSTPDARFNWKAGGESRFKRQTQGRRSLLVTPLRSRSIRVHASPLTLSTSQRALSPVWRPFSARFGLPSYSPCVIMLETSRDDLFLPSYQDEEMVDNLLSSQDLDGDGGGGGVSLAKALLPLVESPSPPLIPWVCSTRYKTELCTSYSATGVCKYAERCQFAHGLHELHVPFHHPKYKTELCRSYHTTGYCYYGSRCLFVHNPTEQRPAQRRRRNVPCRTFRSFGVCPFGTRCNFLHVKGGDVSNCLESPDLGEEKTPPVPSPQLQPQAKEWKPRGALCRTFSSFGFCLYGTRCRFQHGLPSKIKNSDQIQGGSLYPQLSPGSSGLPSPTSPVTVTSPNSSTSSSPSASPLTTPPAEATAHNAFTFSSQHLSDLLLPLALHLQQLESNKAQEIWDNRAL